MTKTDIKRKAEQISSYWFSTSPKGCVEDICKLVDRAVKEDGSKWKKAMFDSTGNVVESSVAEVKSEKRRVIRKLIAILHGEAKGIT